MKITDSLKKLVAVAGLATVGMVSANAQIDLINQPLPVAQCLGDETAYIDIIPLYDAQFEPFLMFEWFKQMPDGSVMSVRYDGNTNVGGPDAEGSRLQFPALTEPMAGEYYGIAWIDNNPQDGMFDPFNEASIQTDLVVVNVLSEPSIITETVSVFMDDDISGEPIRSSMSNSTLLTAAGNTVLFDIDAHIFGQYENTHTTNPDYNIDIQWYTEDQNQQPVMLTDDNMYAGTNSDQLTINVTADVIGNVYWADLTGQCGTVTTSQFTLSDVPQVSFNTQPADMEVCPGVETVLEAEAVVTGGIGEVLSYQWMKGGQDIMDGAEFTGATSGTLTIASGYITDDISDIALMVTSTPSMETAKTDPFVITVTDDPTYTTDLDGNAINLTAGDPLSLTVAADGATSYQWYKDGTMLSGETMATLDIAATISDDSGVYLAHAINDCGVEVPSTPVTVTVTASGIISSVRGVVPGSISVSPNPTAETATARLSLESFAKNAVFTLHNATGQVVSSQSFENNGQELVAEFDVNKLNLADGMYFVVINVDGQTITERLVVASK